MGGKEVGVSGTHRKDKILQSSCPTPMHLHHNNTDHFSCVRVKIVHKCMTLIQSVVPISLIQLFTLNVKFKTIEEVEGKIGCHRRLDVLTFPRQTQVHSGNGWRQKLPNMHRIPSKVKAIFDFLRGR